MKPEEYYNSFRKKYDLPDFAVVNLIFGLDDVENPNLGKIAERMAEKFGKYREILESFLSADGGDLAAVMEVKNFDDKDHAAISDLFKKCIIAERSLLCLDIVGKEEDFAPLIKDLYSAWNGLREDLSRILTKARDSWSQDTKITDEIGDLG